LRHPVRIAGLAKCAAIMADALRLRAGAKSAVMTIVNFPRCANGSGSVFLRGIRV